jgi:probable H4MPT-linked C1 transfer pathway protein
VTSGEAAPWLGWDIGGVNTKAARLSTRAGAPARIETASVPFEIQRDPSALPAVLAMLARRLGRSRRARHAVTMTAELSQAFRTKREGVRFVLDALVQAFPGDPIQVYLTDGRFVSPEQAKGQFLEAAASNWVATATLVARFTADALLVDIGSTSTDIVPIVGARVVAAGWTDPERLSTGELVYTGAVRTPAEALVRQVPLGHGRALVSAEGFATVGDAHVWLGRLRPDDYTAPTADGRSVTRELAGERLARVVCGDRELLDEGAVDGIAHAIVEAQVELVADALRRVMAMHPSLGTAVVTGLGDFIAEDAARRAGLSVERLSARLGDGARVAPAAAVVWLLAEQAGDTGDAPSTSPLSGADAGELPTNPAPGTPERHTGPGTSEAAPRLRPTGRRLCVVKVGGGLSRDLQALETVGTALAEAGRRHRILVVPGGGPFADAVRTFDQAGTISADAAHWMAILAMDQYAHALVEAIPGATLVEEPGAVGGALRDGGVAVLAPYRWLRAADVLPHSWDATSDSVAAFVAGALDADRLVLVKPVDGTVEALTDRCFAAVVPAGLSVEVVGWRRIGELERRLEPIPPP